MTTPAMPEFPPITGYIASLQDGALNVAVIEYAKAYALAALSSQPPELAGVSYDQLQAIDDEHNWQTLAGRMAAYRAILALRPAQQAHPLPDDLYDSKDWRQGNYASRVEWLVTMYEHAKRERDELAAQQAVPMTDAWRLLNPWDRIESGDECLKNDCVTWEPLSGWEVGMFYNPAVMVPLRRRHHGITAPAAQAKGAGHE